MRNDLYDALNDDTTILLELLRVPVIPPFLAFFGGVGNDVGGAVVRLKNGDYLMAASTPAGYTVAGNAPINAHSGGTDLVLVKFTRYGVYQWHTFFGAATAGITVRSVIEANDGSIVVGGNRSGPLAGATYGPFGINDAFIARFGADGNPLWYTYIGGGANDSGGYLAQHPDGGFVIAGDSSGAFNAVFGAPLAPWQGNADAFLVKLDIFGNYQWHTFTGSPLGNEFTRAVAITPDGSIVIGAYGNMEFGSPVNGFSGSFDFLLIKYLSSGAYLWHSFAGGGGTEIATGLAPVFSFFDNGIVMVGNSSANFGTPINPHAGGGGDDLVIVKFNAAGMPVWNTFLGDTLGNEQARAVVLGFDGGITVAGSGDVDFGSPLAPFIGGASDILLARFSAEGMYQWHTFAGSPGNDIALSIALDLDGGSMVTGTASQGFGTPLYPYNGAIDQFIAKFSMSGAF